MAQLGFLRARFLLWLERLELCRVAIGPLELREVQDASDNVSNFYSNNESPTYAVRFS